MTATLPRPRPRPAPDDAPRAVIYTRVSSDPNDRGRSVSEQEAECRAVCAHNGWQVARVFSDNDRSASRYAAKDRSQYRRLIQFIEGGSADVLVTWEASRGQRDLADYLRLRDVSERMGVLWSYSGRTFDLAEGDDRFSTGLDALLAERESEQTRKRVLRAVRANANEGRPHGKLLYGYRRDYELVGGVPKLIRQVPDPETAPVVQEAARRVLAGETPYAVAKDFNARGIATPRGAARGWDLSQIKRMCVNPGYAGRRIHQGKDVGEAIWPPLLSDDEHYALVAKLGDPRRRTQRDGAIRHLLSGIAVCGVCGGPTRVQKNRGYLAYLCVDGFHVSRHQDDLDDYITEIVLQRLERPDAAAVFAPVPADGEAAAARAEVLLLRARLEGFYDTAAAGDLSPAALARIEGSLLPQIEAAERRARGAAPSPLISEIAGPDVRGRWEGLSMPQRRDAIRCLINIRILPTVRGTRTFRTEAIDVTWKVASP